MNKITIKLKLVDYDVGFCTKYFKVISPEKYKKARICAIDVINDDVIEQSQFHTHTEWQGFREPESSIATSRFFMEVV